MMVVLSCNYTLFLFGLYDDFMPRKSNYLLKMSCLYKLMPITDLLLRAQLVHFSYANLSSGKCGICTVSFHRYG
jgi:hypothetical protein